MRAISLITDFGLKDNFVGVMKAVILRINPQARIIDLCHEVAAQNILQAAFLLKGSLKYFAKGTVFLAVVDPGVGSQRKKIVVKTENYFFVAPDNGVLSFALKDEAPKEIIEITNEKYFLIPVSDTFHGRDIFAPVAAHLSRLKPPAAFGRRIKSLKELELPEAKAAAKCLEGQVIYIDRFGNLVTNIREDVAVDFIKNKRFELSFKNRVIKRISRSYCEAMESEPLVLIGSFGYLEIAVNFGSAERYFKAKLYDKVTVELKS